jgi:hypothetical protein
MFNCKRLRRFYGTNSLGLRHSRSTASVHRWFHALYSASQPALESHDVGGREPPSLLRPKSLSTLS